MKPVEETFRFLRVRVQHGTALPTLVVVGAALRGDGATFVACGLARAFAEAGHATLLLDANPRNSGIADELGMTFGGSAGKPQHVSENFSVASLFDREERLLGDDELDTVVAHVRSQYAVTIVDTPAIPRSGAALQIARIADGLLVAVRLGRRPVGEDQEMKLLMQPGGMLGDKAVSGIIPTHAVKRRTSAHEPAEAFRSPIIDVSNRTATRFQTTGR